jgi:hypothetical protein
MLASYLLLYAYVMEFIIASNLLAVGSSASVIANNNEELGNGRQLDATNNEKEAILPSNHDKLDVNAIVGTCMMYVAGPWLVYFCFASCAFS